MLKALGKQELKDLGCNFIVMNVPVFAAVNSPSQVHKMTTYHFKSLDDIKLFMREKMPVAVFDLTGVYKDKADRQDEHNGFIVRCCPLPMKEFEILRSNVRETENLNFTYKVDFSCWFAGVV